jgi:hypothetical protein
VLSPITYVIKVKRLKLLKLWITHHQVYVHIGAQTTPQSNEPPLLHNHSHFSGLCTQTLLIFFSCELISTYTRMSSDLEQCHRMLGRNVIHCLLALFFQRESGFGKLKGFQSRLTVRENTNIFFWSKVHMNFICTAQGSLYLGLENSSIFSYRDTEPLS